MARPDERILAVAAGSVRQVQDFGLASDSAGPADPGRRCPPRDRPSAAAAAGPAARPGSRPEPIRLGRSAARAHRHRRQPRPPP
jgi:hypothetical protein